MALEESRVASTPAVAPPQGDARLTLGFSAGLSIGPIGSHNAILRVIFGSKGSVWVETGWEAYGSSGGFAGTLDEFEEAVVERHPGDNLYRSQYMAAIVFIRAMADIRKHMDEIIATIPMRDEVPPLSRA